MITGNEPIHEIKGITGTTIIPDAETIKWIKEANPYIGLTIRQHFANTAMQGIISNSFYQSQMTAGMNEAFAKDAVALSDALIEELNKDKSEITYQQLLKEYTEIKQVNEMLLQKCKNILFKGISENISDYEYNCFIGAIGESLENSLNY